MLVRTSQHHNVKIIVLCHAVVAMAGSQAGDCHADSHRVDGDRNAENGENAEFTHQVLRLARDLVDGDRPLPQQI